MEPNIKALKDKWIEAKANEDAARKERLQVEQWLVDLMGKDLPEKGTTKVCEGMKVTTGYNEKWDQELLADILKNISYAPFEVVYKPIRSELDALQKMHPKDWMTLQRALEVTPKKPSFKVEE